MKFIVNYPYASTYDQLAENDRGIVDGLYDGQHDININSASIVSASITDATITSALITSANITSMSLGFSDRISAANIYGTSGSFGSAYIGSGLFDGFSATTFTAPTGGITSATIQTLQNPTYANIASANITTALIASATITSATITGAKIGTLQGMLKGSAGIVGVGTAGSDYENPLTFSAPISRSVDTVGIAGASSGVNGYLKGTDWSTFNNKESAITSAATTTYFRGDKSFQTLNQAAVVGVTTSDSPTFAGATLGSLAGILFGTSGAISALSAPIRMKAGAFTRDYAGGSGNVAYTGVGFGPGTVLFLASVNGSSENMTSIGWMDASGNQGHLSHGADNLSYVAASGAILMHGGGTDAQSAALTSMDPDGFTLGWTKSGTPGGTITCQYLALR